MNGQLTTKNIHIDGPLLPETMANLVTSVSLATRISLRCSSIFFDTLFEAAKYGTSVSLGISRNAITHAISTAKNLHSNQKKLTCQSNQQEQESLFYKVLEKYTNFGLDLVNHTFSLTELFAMSGLQFTSRTIQSSLKAAEESVRIIDGIFGSNETSRAIASIISLIHRELVQDPDFGLAKAGKIAILAGLTKALTAFAVLQNVTHKRMMKQIPMTILWEGVVTDEKEDEDYHKLIKFKQNQPNHNLPQPSDHNQILLELSNLLQSDQKAIEPLSTTDQTSLSKISRSSVHNAYKVTTKTTYLTTQTTTISPLEDPSFKKKIIVRSNQEENQSYLALLDQKQPAKFILSALSEKTKKRKVERQENIDMNYNHQRRFSSPDDSLNYEQQDSFSKKYSHSTSDLPHTRQRHASISSLSSCIISTDNNKRTIKKKRSSSISSCSSDGAIQFNSSFTMTSTLQESYHEDEQNHIINNIAHFMRYASAAYGESFMRILGIGDIPTDLPSTHHHHPNHHAFAHHTGNSVEDILLSSYTDRSPLHLHNPSIHALVHYVTVDHAAKAIVLTCRGTLGLSDILTDLSFDYTEFTLPQTNKTFKAHSGMLDAAQLLAKEKGKVYQKIRQGLDSYPDYGLVMCGHSLGAGVASLLCVLWSKQMTTGQQPFFVTSSKSGLPPGRPIHCYAYGPPGVMSLDLSNYCAGLVTSVVHGYDIVSSLSLGLLKDFKNIATSLHAESNAADEIISRVVGRLQQKKNKKKKQIEEDEDDQWFWAMIKTMRADMTAEKMFPPSTVYIIETIPHTKQQHKVVLCRCDDVQARFSEIVFTRTMFMDHSPLMYEKAIRKLCRGVASY